MNRRAFTLLELLLAVSVLAAMSLIIGAVWRQTTGWAGDDARRAEALRLPRVAEMMRSQWGDRRTSAALNEEGATVALVYPSLEFLTATPVLRPGWPMVLARYTIERDDAGPHGAAAWRLVYEETPVVDMGVPVGPGAEAGRGPASPVPPAESRSLVLLRGCSELRWERLDRLGDRRDRISRRRDEILALGDEAERRREEAALEERAGRALLERPSASGDADWREVTPDDEDRKRLPPAVRLAGVYKDRRFSCLFVIGDSR